MFKFNRKLKNRRVKLSFVETESGRYLFNLPNSDIVMEIDTLEQVIELQNKLSKYYSREGTLLLLGLIFGSNSSFLFDSIVIIIVLLNYHLKWSFWPGIYSYFSEELTSSPRGSFTDFKFLQVKGNISKIKFKFLIASSFAFICFLLGITNSEISVFLINFLGSKLFVNIALLSIAFETGLTALRLKSVLNELPKT